MVFVRRPSDARIRAFVASQERLPFSYPDVGRSRSNPPLGYVVDHNRVKLGHGRETFDAAVAAVRSWHMFAIGWVEVLWPDAAIAPDSSVAVLARWSGLWFLNACRIVYVIDEQAPIRRFGFAYGTLPEHAESGEERFSIEWLDDDSVWYDLLAFSRPNLWSVRVGRPFARRLQRRFARDSMAAMSAAARLRPPGLA